MPIMQVNLDDAVAAKVAEYFEVSGMASAAISMWKGLCRCTPYDLDARKKLAGLLDNATRTMYPHGSMARHRNLLSIIGQSFPTPELTPRVFRES